MAAWQRWCTTDHEARKYEFWHDAVCSGVVESELAVDCRSSFHGTLFSRTRADVRLVNFASAQHRIRRSSTQVHRQGGDRLMLSLQCQGNALLSQKGVVQDVAAGEFGLLNAGAPFEIAFPAQTSRRLILLPRHLFGANSPVLKALDRPLKLAGGSRLAPLLTETVRLLTDTDTAVHDRATDALVGTVVELLAMELGERDGLRAHSRNAAELSFDTIRKFTELHLTDPELSPAMVASACRVSVRTLHRLFRRYADSSFESHVIEARLALSEQMLRARRTRTVSEAAYACGFNNVSHFTKRFSERFGVSPVQLLRAPDTLHG
ncbi:MAG: helix-turn-helix domain-containing protein [Burkholderiaceae bacterium]